MKKELILIAGSIDSFTEEQTIKLCDLLSEEDLKILRAVFLQQEYVSLQNEYTE